MKPTLSRQPTADEIQFLRDSGRLKNGKAIIGQAQYDDITFFILEDGTELCEDENGNAAQWPEA